MKSTFLSVALLCLLISTAHAMTIVENHQPRAVIVVNADASDKIKNAAKELQAYIQKSTGALLPIRNTPEDGNNIDIGATDFAKTHHLNPGDLDQDGFILQGVDNTNFAITGGSDWGTEFGVYDFLERYLDVRWLAGGDLFTDVPQHATVDIPPAKVRQEPVIRSRQLGPMGFEWSHYDATQERFQSMPWSAMKMYDDWGRFNRLYPRTQFHHNLYKVFPVSEFGESHPEFYPLIKGKRLFPKSDKNASTWQPNFSAPGSADVAVAHIEKYFSENPQASSFSLAINDSQNFDQSPETLQRREQLGGLPDEYATWVNDVASKVLLKYPDKTFGFLAYISLRTPPKNVKYNAHAVPYITYELSRWSDPAAREFAQSLARQWQTSAAQIGWYDYFYGSFYMLPRSFEHAEADALRWLSRNGVKNYYAEDNPNFGEGPKDWVQTKLLWNPHQNVDALINDWCTHAVGNAAAPSLQKYFSLWEKFWSQDLPKSSWYNRKADYQSFAITDYLLDVPREYLEQSDRFLNEAVQLADTPLHKQRAEKLRQMWQFYKASVIARQGDEYWKTADLQTEKDAIQLLQKCTEAIDQSQHRLQIMSDLRKDDLYGYPIYRVTSKADLIGDNWGASSLWSLLPWVSKSTFVRDGLKKIAQAPQKQLWRLSGSGQDIPLQNAASQIAAQVLKAGQGGMTELLQNSSFESDLQNWQSSGFQPSSEIAQDGNKSTFANTSGATLSQKAAYEPGDYYVIFHAYTPKSTSAKVTLSLTAINQLNRQRGRNLPAGTITLHAGKWSTFVIPVTLTDLRVTDTMSLLVKVTTQNMQPGDVVYIDDIGVYPASEK
jgi:hypothetical protein